MRQHFVSEDSPIQTLKVIIQILKPMLRCADSQCNEASVRVSQYALLLSEFVRSLTAAFQTFRVWKGCVCLSMSRVSYSYLNPT